MKVAVDAVIKVEIQPTVVPKPISFVVFRDNKPVGVLTLEQVTDALVEYATLYNRWHKSRG